ncbi:SIR2 family protein [Georgenia muralis]|uniref:SIR2-like protein n=1 Tax=Georgenia muralis TaxID=154117 RepID=A0A3N4ZAT3_9MICO|nr:SIR2 family protein [Georgenia muralis]RPF29046.1 SIR2-like protein [Georgenia muralis]
MSGHLFVIHGDLRKLACDGIAIPCDDRFNITDVWSDFLPGNLPRVPGTGWLRLPHPSTGTAVALPDSDGRRVTAVATVHDDMTITSMVQRMLDGVTELAGGLEARGGRDRPLLGVPMIGTGAGGLHHQRGEVIDVYLPALATAARDHGFDIALVVQDRRDVAAVQARRTDEQWAALPEHLEAEADRLGTMAAKGQLSLFIGAGVSKPVGLPDWQTLLRILAERAQLPTDWPDDADPLDVATSIAEKLEIEAELGKILGTPRHGIGHALLAGLRPREMVTTNFDPCMEHALESVLGEEGFRVMTRRLADGALPWLLKLHGDIARPGSVVLTRAHYDAHAEEYKALAGVVQSLMLTSHLLFVGFSMTDRDFLDMAAAVARVRADAEPDGASSRPTAGTVLPLIRKTDQEFQLEGDLTFLPMAETGSVAEAARTLEVFLDRLSWTAARTHSLSAEYLLDERYLSGLSPADRALRDALIEFERTISPAARSSVGWDKIRETLEALGAKSR